MRGTIRRRGETWTWQHVVTRGGKRRYVTGTKPTKRLAQAALAESLAAHAKGARIEPGKVDVATYLRGWLVLVQPRLKAGTWRAYHDIVEHRLIPYLGDERLSELEPETIAAAYSELRSNGRRDGKGGLSETSLEHTHRCLHAALEAAVRGRRLASNPADGLEVKPKRRHVEMRTWSGPELAAFLASTAEHRLHALFVTAATTAMRRGELLGLRWADVDLDAARLSVRRSRTSVAYEVVEDEPKSRKSVRVIDLDAETVAVLRTWRRHQVEERLAWGPAWTETGLVFTREDGTGLHPHHVADAFEAAVKRSGQPVVRFHDLRHTWATLALRAGVSPKIVSERLGHASVGFTLDTYAHAVPGWQAEAAATVAGLVFAPNAVKRLSSAP